MNILGIQLTPGHLILMAATAVIYDAIWTWIASNPAAAWWFERLQGFLKLAIYAGFIGLTVLVVNTPWPWNLVLVIAVIVCVLCAYYWLKKRAELKKKKDEEA